MNKHKEILFNLVNDFNFKIENNTCEKPTFKNRISCYAFYSSKFDYILNNENQILDYITFNVYTQTNGFKEILLCASYDIDQNMKLLNKLINEFPEEFYFDVEVACYDKIKTHNFKECLTVLSIEYILANLILSQIKTGITEYKLLIDNDKLLLFKHSTEFLEYLKNIGGKDYYNYFYKLFDKCYQQFSKQMKMK